MRGVVEALHDAGSSCECQACCTARLISLVPALAKSGVIVRPEKKVWMKNCRASSASLAATADPPWSESRSILSCMIVTADVAGRVSLAPISLACASARAMLPWARAKKRHADGAHPLE